MKKSFSVILSFLILLTSMNNAVLFGFFKLNQQNIESNLCINKSKPLKKCHGKCYLKKLLKQRNEQKNMPSGQILSIEQNQWYKPVAGFYPDDGLPFLKTTFLNNSNIPYRDFYRKIYHPPKVYTLRV